MFSERDKLTKELRELIDKDIEDFGMGIEHFKIKDRMRDINKRLELLN